MVLFETILRVLLALGQVILLQKIAHKDEHLVFFFIEFYGGFTCHMRARDRIWCLIPAYTYTLFYNTRTWRSKNAGLNVHVANVIHVCFRARHFSYFITSCN